MEVASKQYYDNFLQYVVSGNPNSKKAYEDAEKRMEELIAEAESSLPETPDLKKIHDVSTAQIIRGQVETPSMSWRYIALAVVGSAMIAMMFL